MKDYIAGRNVILELNIVIVVVGSGYLLYDSEFYLSVGLFADHEVSYLGVVIFIQNVLKIFDGHDIISLLKLLNSS